MRAAALVLLLLVSPVAAAGAAAPPVSLSGLTTWATSGTRVAFVASEAGGTRGYLWTQGFGAARPAPLRARPPVGQEEIDALAPGPRGSWAALERTRTGADRLDVVSSRGGGATVASGTLPAVFGDGAFLGYLSVAPSGAVQLHRVGPGAHTTRVAALAGVSKPQQAVVASGTLAVRDADGSVGVFTVAGAHLATIDAHAASVALTENRVVVRSRAKHLVVYGLHGGLVHDWRLAAATWTAGLGAYGRYAVYLGANKAVHVVRLADGRDRVVARAGAGWYFGGVSLQAPGAVVPLTTNRGTTLRFLPTSTLAAALAR